MASPAAATPGYLHMNPTNNSTSGQRLTSHRNFRKGPSNRLMPSTAASIPSRYQTFFYSNSENKGFNSRATRFSDHLNTNDNPGPGSYSYECGELGIPRTSFSKKGLGGFASKSRRFPRERIQKLGPGSHNPQPVENRVDFNRAGVGSNFQKPIAVKSDDPTKGQSFPAPNTYNLSDVHTGRNNLVAAEAAFKSKTKRDVISLQTAGNPAPCQYTIQDQLMHISAPPHKSVFDSKTPRGDFAKPVKEQLRNQDLHIMWLFYLVYSKGPGPADYSPFPVNQEPQSNKPTELPYYRQKHYLCISAPALPLPPLPPPPGPGHYETQDQMTTATNEKHLVSGAVFKSNTSRWMSANIHHGASNPGPGTYNPSLMDKRSYLYNVQGRWI